MVLGLRKLLIVALLVPCMSVAAEPRLLALCYHDVVVDQDAEYKDDMAVSVDRLIQHFSWLHQSGYTPISLAHWQSGQDIPDKPVLLTFDDGYKSFATKVVPLLELYGYPAVLAPVTSWIDTPANQPVQYGDEERPREQFLTWRDIEDVLDSDLVEVASHSHDLHRGALANSFGNKLPAAASHLYDDAAKHYETDQEFVARLTADLTQSQSLLQTHLEQAATAMVWPYGAYNGLAVKAATEAGMPTVLTLDEGSNIDPQAFAIHRKLISNRTDARDLKRWAEDTYQKPPLRAAHIDIDYLFDEDPDQFNRNLDLLLDRIKAMKLGTVFLQAFADPDGDGVADALYFQNRHLPVRADIFNRVAWQLNTRAEVEVYAWMPVLAFALPDKRANAQLAVASTDGSHRTRYHRLSPFDAEARRVIAEIYGDLGRSSRFSGVLFHDDAFLTDREDVGTAAQQFLDRHNISKLPVNHRTEALLRFTDELTRILRFWQPGLKTSRNLYAEVLLNPRSEQWFAQNYQQFLGRYDYVALMAMPFLEGAEDPRDWLRDVVARVAATPNGLGRTVFHMQTRDWNIAAPIDNVILAEHFDLLLRNGVQHIAYYPDDFHKNHPRLEIVRGKLSINEFPALKEDWD